MELPYFPFYAADFFTKTINLSDAQAGRYIRLLCLEWINGPLKEVPDDLKNLFKKTQKGYINKRLEDERGKSMERHARAVLAADKRWGKKPKKKSVAMPEHMHGEHGAKHMQSDPDPDPELETELKGVIKVRDFHGDDSNQMEIAWKIWKKYKKEEHGFKYKSQLSETAALATLAKFSGGDIPRAMLIIKKSIANGWKGFFELKPSDLKELNKNKDDEQFDDLRKKYGL